MICVAFYARVHAICHPQKSCPCTVASDINRGKFSCTAEHSYCTWCHLWYKRLAWHIVARGSSDLHAFNPCCDIPIEQPLRNSCCFKANIIPMVPWHLDYPSCLLWCIQYKEPGRISPTIGVMINLAHEATCLTSKTLGCFSQLQQEFVQRAKYGTLTDRSLRCAHWENERQQIISAHLASTLSSNAICLGKSIAMTFSTQKSQMKLQMLQSTFSSFIHVHSFYPSRTSSSQDQTFSRPQ